MAEDITIHGLADLHKLLQELPAKVEANVLRGGLRAGAKVMEAEAKETLQRNRSIKTGELLRSIRVSMRSKRGIVQARIIAGNKTAWYAHLVERGTARHFIKPKSRKSLFFAGLMREVADHPGAQRKPFMRPAFDAKSREALETMAEYIRLRLPREFRKLQKR